MDNLKISVIVPVYNAEQYLPRCIDSILAQTFTDFELLLIDDGSTDNSGKICDEYAEKDNRIRVFHKENGGVSSARNIGIDNTNGEWMCFVDSDDWVTSNYLSSFYTKCQEFFKDILLVSGCNYIFYSYMNKISLENHIYDKHNLYESIIILRNKKAFGILWNKMFSTSIIKREYLRFDENLSLYEDELFILQYMQHINMVITLSNVTYNYSVATSVNSLSVAFIDVHQHILLAHRLEEEGLHISSNNIFKQHCHEYFVSHLKNKICQLYKTELTKISRKQRYFILNTIISEIKACNCMPILRKQLRKKFVILSNAFCIDLQMRILYLPLIYVKHKIQLIIKSFSKYKKLF